MLFLGGFIIALIGILGEYIGRIYLSINRQPQYVVRGVTRGSDAAAPKARKQSEVSGHEDDACGMGA